MKIQISDLAEIGVWSKKQLFFSRFFDLHGSQPNDTVLSICDAYEATEVEWVLFFGGRCYKNSETFVRTYYYLLNQNIKLNKTQKSWIELTK